MKLFYYTHDQVQVHPVSSAVAAKWAYMFTDGVVLTPHANMVIHFRHGMEQMGLRGRIAIMTGQLKAEDPEACAQMEKALEAYNHICRKKNRSKQELALMRQTEKAINKYFVVMVDELCASLEKTGMHVLGQINTVDDESISYFNVNMNAPESDTGDYTPASTLLQLLDDDDVTKDLKDISFILPVEALTSLYCPAHIHSPEDDAATDESSIWLERVMDLPNINLLTALELQVLRSQMQKAGKAFFQAFDEWTKVALDGSQTAQQRLSFYKDTVRPAAADWSTAARQSKLLSNMRAAAFGHAACSVWIGEMPMQSVWDFYFSIGLAGDTMEKLKTPEAMVRGKMRVPVVVLGSDDLHNIMTPDARADSQESLGFDMPVSARKRIILD